MSSLRNLITGSDICAPEQGSQGGNVISSLASMLLERTRANQRNRQGGPSTSSAENFFETALTPEERQQMMKDTTEVPEPALLNGKERRVESQATPDATAHLVPAVQDPISKDAAFDGVSSGIAAETDFYTSFLRDFCEFQRTFDDSSAQTTSGAPQARDFAVSDSLKRFMDCARRDVPFALESFPKHLTFDALEQQKIQTRVQHLCHVIFAEHGPQHAEEQVTQMTRFLQSIGIACLPVKNEVFQQAWNDATLFQAPSASAMFPDRTHNIAQDFSRMTLNSATPQFDPSISNTSQLPMADDGATLHHDAPGDAKEISAALIEQMATDPDPKFKNSKFLQFIQKINNGELVIEGDQIKEGIGAASMARPSEGRASNDHPWLEDFERQVRETVPWGQEIGSLEGGWLERNESQEWIDNYEQMAYGPIEVDREYIFVSDNPFVEHPNALDTAKELFSRGNLNEAVAASESVVHKEPENVDAWILIGRIHAENDNDIQAIAAFNRAHAIDSSNLEALLNLGVSHANELHEPQAVAALTSWLQQHPQYHSHPAAHSQPKDPSQGLSHTMRVFHQILADHSNDPDVLVALGVLHHLGRSFEEAISLFQSATRLRPDDYTLWNKLGATQANAARSGESIDAYHRCLQQKPNYMRGWANLGISYANVGDYAASVQHYIRALTLNRESDTVWCYLQSSAICAGFVDLLQAIENRDLDVLTRRFPAQG